MQIDKVTAKNGFVSMTAPNSSQEHCLPWAIIKKKAEQERPIRCSPIDGQIFKCTLDGSEKNHKRTEDAISGVAVSP